MKNQIVDCSGAIIYNIENLDVWRMGEQRYVSQTECLACKFNRSEIAKAYRKRRGI